MAELDFTEIAGTSILTPGSGVVAVYADPTNSGSLKVKDDAGFQRGSVYNFSTALQQPSATTRTYIAGSALAVPKNKLQIGTIFKWGFSLTKTAAGSASSTIDIAFGTAGTTADTARVSFTKPAGTTAADEAWFDITAICRGPLSASGVVVGTMRMVHNLENTGHAVIPAVCVTTISSGFDVTVADLIVGLCITSGASDVITLQTVTAEAYNL